MGTSIACVVSNTQIPTISKKKFIIPSSKCIIKMISFFLVQSVCKPKLTQEKRYGFARNHAEILSNQCQGK